MEDNKIYTVEITGCLQPDIYWYFDKIGRQFECRYRENQSFFWPTDMIFTTVTPTNLAPFGASVIHEHGNILPCDCRIVKEVESGTNIQSN